jgi:hypothetical protein
MAFKLPEVPFNDNKERSPTINMREAVGRMLKAYELEGQMRSTHVINFWPKLMGGAVANRTSRIYMRGTTLYVEVQSGPLKAQLNLTRTQIIALLNAEAGAGTVEALVVF